jgi:acyl-CoA thioester hydrolase
MNIDEEIKDCAVIFTIPVQWGDMDSARHVNNLVYFRWAESARIEYFKAIGIDTSFSSETGPILGWQDCKYIFPMTYPDVAIITCCTKEIKEDRFIMESRVYSQEYDRIAAISTQMIIPYDYVNLKKAAIPASWIETITDLEKK